MRRASESTDKFELCLRVLNFNWNITLHPVVNYLISFFHLSPNLNIGVEILCYQMLETKINCRWYMNPRLWITCTCLSDCTCMDAIDFNMQDGSRIECNAMSKFNGNLYEISPSEQLNLPLNVQVVNMEWFVAYRVAQHISSISTPSKLKLVFSVIDVR